MRTNSIIARKTVLLAACAGLGVAAAALAHPDDPKEKDRVPRYEGPGYRLGQDSPIGFPSEGVLLMSWMPLGEFGGYSSANDCWGYESPSGREYAIIGLSSATGVVEITDPGNPQIVGVISAPSSTWRDIKVYDEYAYAVSEGGGGIQVLDLTDADNGNVSLAGSVGGNSSSHNVALDEESGFLYLTGGSGNGLVIYDLSDPANPVQVGAWPDRYVHDAQIVTYTSGKYAGRQIAFCCSGFSGGSVETGIDILDVTNKGDILDLARMEYPNGAYSHQAWLNDDRSLLYLNDEADEGGGAFTRTIVVNVTDIEAPFTAGQFDNGNTAIGHNLYVRPDGMIFEANYRSGLRVFDASSHPLNPEEVGFFDTWEGDDNANFNGLWSCYPLFSSGTVIGSDVEKGLFVWRVTEPMLAFTYPDGLPDLVDPIGDKLRVQVEELEAGGLVPGSLMLNYTTGESFTAVPLENVEGTLYEAFFPASECGSEFSFYVSGENVDGFIESDPPSAPGSTYTTTSAYDVTVVMEDDGETDPGWTVQNIDLEDGGWDRGVPNGGDISPGDRGDPPTDFDGSGQCWLTDNTPQNSDVDGGPTRLTSQTLDLAEGDPYISYARWFTNDDNDIDRLDVHMSNNGGSSWVLVESVGHDAGWNVHTFRVTDVIALTSNMKIRFSATDNPNNSVTEAAIDALLVINYGCESPCPADIDGDGSVGFGDTIALLAAWGPCPGCPEDLDGDDAVGLTDLLAILSGWGPCE